MNSNKTPQELSDRIVEITRKCENIEQRIRHGNLLPGELCAFRADLREYDRELNQLKLELAAYNNTQPHHEYDDDLIDAIGHAAAN